MSNLTVSTLVDTFMGSADLPAAQATLGIITDYITKTANYTAVDKDQILGDTSGDIFTILLPATPTVGQFVVIADAKNTWGTNNLTVGRNGQLIESTAANLTADINGVQITLVFVGGGVGWRVLYQMATATVPAINYASVPSASGVLNGQLYRQFRAFNRTETLHIDPDGGISQTWVGGVNTGNNLLAANLNTAVGHTTTTANSAWGWMFLKHCGAHTPGVAGKYTLVSWNKPLWISMRFQVINTLTATSCVIGSYGMDSTDVPMRTISGTMQGAAWVPFRAGVWFVLKGDGSLSIGLCNEVAATSVLNATLAAGSVDITGSPTSPVQEIIFASDGTGNVSAFLNGAFLATYSGGQNNLSGNDNFPLMSVFNEPTGTATDMEVQTYPMEVTLAPY